MFSPFQVLRLCYYGAVREKRIQWLIIGRRFLYKCIFFLCCMACCVFQIQCFKRNFTSARKKYANNRTMYGKRIYWQKKWHLNQNKKMTLKSQEVFKMTSLIRQTRKSPIQQVGELSGTYVSVCFNFTTMSAKNFYNFFNKPGWPKVSVPFCMTKFDYN